MLPAKHKVEGATSGSFLEIDRFVFFSPQWSQISWFLCGPVWVRVHSSPGLGLPEFPVSKMQLPVSKAGV